MKVLVTGGLGQIGSHIAETKASHPHEAFLWEMNEDSMAHEKLADGIRKFSADQAKLEQVMANHAAT